MTCGEGCSPRALIGRWKVIVIGLTAFVFIPEHVHLMIYPLPEADTIDALLKAIKRPFSYRVKQLLIQSGSRLLERLTIHQRPGVSTFRYWGDTKGSGVFVGKIGKHKDS